MNNEKKKKQQQKQKENSKFKAKDKIGNICNYFTFTVWLNSFNNGLYNFQFYTRMSASEKRRYTLVDRIFNDIFIETASLAKV